MKILFLGNMNNMPLQYARVLRELGHNVQFFVDAPPTDTLSRPEGRYNEYKTYPKWVTDLGLKRSIVSYAFPDLFLRGLVRRFNRENYDGVVLNGYAVSLATRLRAPTLALLAGADLDVVCEPDVIKLDAFQKTFGALSGFIRYLVQMQMLRRQTAGLRACGAFNYYPEGAHLGGERLLRRIYQGLDPLRIQIRGTDCDQLVLSEPSDRTGDDVTIFVPVRMLWQEPLPAGFTVTENKRNDIIIRGLAAFMKTSPARPRIVLVEKGPDVAATKALAAELGIADRLTWIPQMTQIEIIDWYRSADIVFDQLGEHLMGAVGYDCMLLGRCVIANARPEVLTPLIGEESPVCQARTPEDVAGWLHRLVNDPPLRREIGIRCHNYVRRHFNMRDTAKAIETYLAAARR